MEGEKRSRACVVLSDILLEHPAIASTDRWTSHVTEGYITLTAYFIDKSWDMSQVLATRLVEDPILAVILPLKSPRFLQNSN